MPRRSARPTTNACDKTGSTTGVSCRLRSSPPGSTTSIGLQTRSVWVGNRSRHEDFGVDQIRRPLAFQRSQQILRSQHGHLQASLAGCATHVRRQDDVGKAEQSGMDPGLGFENVQARAGDGPILEGRNQSLLIYYRTPGRVNQKGRALHPPEVFGFDQVAGLGSEGHMQAQVVGFIEQGLAVYMPGAKFLLDGFGSPVTRIIEDTHGESTAASRHGLADVAEAVNTKCLATDFGAPKQSPLPLLPAAFAKVAVAFCNAPGYGE